MYVYLYSTYILYNIYICDMLDLKYIQICLIYLMYQSISRYYISREIVNASANSIGYPARFKQYFCASTTTSESCLVTAFKLLHFQESMIRLMRYNDFQNEEFATVPGCKGPIPAGSISNRLLHNF